MFTPNNSLDRCNLMLDLAAHRQRALAGNISNIDTPGYIRKDVDFSQYLGSMNSPLETKLSEKLGPSAVIQDQQGGVDSVYELSELHKNSVTYRTAIKRINATLTELKTVISVGS